MGRAMLLLLMCSLAYGSEVRAQDDPIAKTLDDAKAEYERKSGDIRDEVLKAIQFAEDRATKNPNKTFVDRLDADRAAFESEGTFPRSIKCDEQERKRDRVHTAMAAAYKKAANDYLKQRKKSEAQIIDDEWKELERVAAEIRLKEMFSTGIALEGRKKNAPNRVTPNGTDEPFRVKIAERTGSTFKGEMLVNGRRTYSMSGEINGNEVSFSSEQKANDTFQQTYKGTLKPRAVEFTFEGVGAGNEGVRGTATLTPAKGR